MKEKRREEQSGNISKEQKASKSQLGERHGSGSKRKAHEGNEERPSFGEVYYRARDKAGREDTLHDDASSGPPPVEAALVLFSQ